MSRNTAMWQQRAGNSTAAIQIVLWKCFLEMDMQSTLWLSLKYTKNEMWWETQNTEEIPAQMHSGIFAVICTVHTLTLTRTHTHTSLLSYFLWCRDPFHHTPQKWGLHQWHRAVLKSCRPAAASTTFVCYSVYFPSWFCKWKWMETWCTEYNILLMRGCKECSVLGPFVVTLVGKESWNAYISVQHSMKTLYNLMSMCVWGCRAQFGLHMWHMFICVVRVSCGSGN